MIIFEVLRIAFIRALGCSRSLFLYAFRVPQPSHHCAFPDPALALDQD